MSRVPEVRTAVLEALRNGCDCMNQITPFVAKQLGRDVTDSTVRSTLLRLIDWEKVESYQVNAALRDDGPGACVVQRSTARYRLKAAAQRGSA